WCSPLPWSLDGRAGAYRPPRTSWCRSRRRSSCGQCRPRLPLVVADVPVGPAVARLETTVGPGHDDRVTDLDEVEQPLRVLGAHADAAVAAVGLALRSHTP